MSFVDDLRVPPKKRFRLGGVDPDSTGPYDDKNSAKEFTASAIEKIQRLQYRLFVEQKQSLLIVLQAPDAAGKDGLIRNVLGQMNPQGCKVFGFKVPTEIERSHDFLWRIHSRVPAAGQVVIFNRSHYEDVLVTRVEKMITEATCNARYDHINAFESVLAESGTRILKIYLHISRKEQLKRFKERLDDPEKHWKLNAADYAARDKAEAYRAAYEDVFYRCNPDHAPWYVVPADHKWFRNCAVAALVLETLESMDPQLPPVEADVDHIRTLYEQELSET
jgi:PPK2 family polyphosphate:nucleotide phosphotransferase